MTVVGSATTGGDVLDGLAGLAVVLAPVLAEPFAGCSTAVPLDQRPAVIEVSDGRSTAS